MRNWYTERMVVLAIDPGYGRCGVAVLEKEGVSVRLRYSDCIETDAKDPFPERLAAVVAACERLLKKHPPDSIAIEKVYFSKNQKTAMRVAEVRGALIALTARFDVPLSEYSPSEVKVAVAGFGNADKKAVTKMLHALVHIEKSIAYDDEYDAIAIGITHLAHYRA